MTGLTGQLNSEAAILPERAGPNNLLYTIATDLHFWIPLIVLVGGLFLLDKLR